MHVLRHVLYEIQMKKIRKMLSLAFIDYTFMWTADTGHITKLISILKINLSCLVKDKTFCTAKIKVAKDNKV